MYVAIPTRGRVQRQMTMASLAGVDCRVGLFCPASEVEELASLHPNAEVVAQPAEDMAIAFKRPWVLRHLVHQGIDKVLMLDDDLRFFTRYTTDDGKYRLRPASTESIQWWFGEMEQRLSVLVPHVGFGPRQGNHTHPDGWQVGRMMLALGYHAPTVLRYAEWGRVRTREDMDITLQLLRRGFPNAVTHEFVVDQVQYGSDGGCSDERTVESSDEDAVKLAALHRGFVRVVERNYRNVPRREVVCSWQKALAAGTQWRAHHPAG